QIPREHLGMKKPGRDRTVHQLGFHVFRISASFVDTREQGYLSADVFEERAPAEMVDGEAVAPYGATLPPPIPHSLPQPPSSYGPQGTHDFMERTTWHAAQHLRQIYWFLDQMGLKAEAPITDTDLAALPIPRDVWS